MEALESLEPPIYQVHRSNIFCDSLQFNLHFLHKFNVICPGFIDDFPRAQEEPTVHYQTWGYDESSGMLILLFDNSARISLAIEYLNATTFETTINKEEYARHKEYFGSMPLRLTTEPSSYDQIDESDIVHNTGRDWINTYLGKRFLWFPDLETWKTLNVPITDENYRMQRPFLQCVLLAISEVEFQWIGSPKIGEINTPLAELPTVTSAPTLYDRIKIYCLYGGYWFWAGLPLRLILMPATAMLGIGGGWFSRGLLIWGCQLSYKYWKRYKVHQLERVLFQEESQLLYDESVLSLQRKRLHDEEQIRPSADLARQQREIGRLGGNILFQRKELELRRRNLYIQNPQFLSRKKRAEFSARISGGI